MADLVLLVAAALLGDELEEAALFVLRAGGLALGGRARDERRLGGGGVAEA